ncbi:MAG TPA: TolC family protein [Rhodocyclaceae bacterium]|nr:TolC family protein [Rhodocyclaceae bacterium]
MPGFQLSFPVVAFLVTAILCTGESSRAGGLADPFDSEALYSAGPGDSLGGNLKTPCSAAVGQSPLTLAEVADQALCNNPQTRLAWANARVQAAQVGVAESAYLPTLSATAGRSRNVSDAGTRFSYSQTTGALSAGYLLYDFGGRAAALDGARQLMAALASTQDATLQAVFLAAVQAYYQWFATEAAVAAARESEHASMESLKAAEARYRIGTGTPADKLQAQTAASQATLSRIQAEGNAKTALGLLANAMGLEAQAAPALAPPEEALPDAAFARNLDELIAAARRSRPDLAAAEAQLKAARANVDATRATGMPSISLTAGSGYSDSGSFAGTTRSSSIGVTLAIPLFSGFNTTYRVRSAEAQVEARAAQRDQLARQVSLDVWRSYYALLTSIESVRASADLVASAEASERVATGRYKAGVGGILDLLNAQSALAGARQQNIQALYNWRIAKAALAQAMGQLDFSQISAK